MSAPEALHSTAASDPPWDSSSASDPYEASFGQADGGPGEWWAQAACRDRNAELFFHADRERGPARALRAAKAKGVCGLCPVMLRCREYALAHREPYGIWGGLDEHERARLLAEQVS